MGKRIVVAVVLAMLAEANYACNAQASDNESAERSGTKANKDYFSRFERLKLAEAKPDDKTASSIPPGATGSGSAPGAVGANAGAPAAGSSTAAPAAGTSTAAPAAGTSTATPAAGLSPAAKPADKPAAAASAAASAQKPQEIDNPDFTSALNKGIDLFNKNKPEEALAEFQKALAINKNNTAVRNWMGAAYQRMNKHKEAAEIYEEVVQMDPNYAEAHNNLGFSYQQLQDLEKAESEYKRALEINAGFIDARFNLACVLQMEKKNDEAITEFENVLKMDPARTDCFLHLGDVAKEAKDFDKALLYYNKAMAEVKKAGKKDPQAMADILCDLSLIDKEKGDKAKCKEGLEKVLDLDPGSYPAQLNLGILAYEDKDFGACLNYLAKALERNPYDAAVHFWLGRYYYSLDSMKNSIKQFTDCTKCDATEHKFPECEEWLDKAKKKQAGF